MMKKAKGRTGRFVLSIVVCGIISAWLLGDSAQRLWAAEQAKTLPAKPDKSKADSSNADEKKPTAEAPARAPKAAPKETPPSSDTPPHKEAEKENVFPQGAFDSAVLDGNMPKEWSPMDKDKVTLEQEGEDRFLRILNDKPEVAVYALARIPIKPAWKRLSLSTRMAGKNLKAGADKNSKAGFAISYEDAEKKRIGGDGYTLFLKADSPWRPMGSELKIPPGAAFIALRVGLHYYTGEVGVDDIKIYVEE